MYRRHYSLDIANRQLSLSKFKDFSDAETFDLNKLNWLDSNLSNNFKQGFLSNWIHVNGTWFSKENKF